METRNTPHYGEYIHVIDRHGKGNTISLSNNVSKPSNDFGTKKNVPGDKINKKMQTWGKNNDLPDRREHLIQLNNIVAPLLNTKRHIILGSEIVAYKKKINNETKSVERGIVEIPKEAAQFFKNTKIRQYFLNAAKNLITHSNVFTEFVLDKSGKVSSIKSLDCKNVRSGIQNENGEVEEYFINGNWCSNDKSNKVSEVISYEYRKKSTKFIYHTGDDMFFDGYYFTPDWWGGAKWIEVANLIPIFHLSNLKHGYTIRYHIRIPKSYFFDWAAYDQAQTDEARKMVTDAANTAEKAFIDDMNKFLAGAENTGRAVFTKTDYEKHLGKELPGVEIQPITTDLKDEALLKLFDKSNQANISAQGIHPTLANIETQGKLSSGSEIRNAYNLYVAIKTAVPRDILMEPIEIVKEMNKWPEDVYYTFQNSELKSLDENPAGKEDVIQQ